MSTSSIEVTMQRQRRRSSSQRHSHQRIVGRRRRMTLAALFALSSMIVITPSESFTSTTRTRTTATVITTTRRRTTTTTTSQRERLSSTRRFFRHISTDDGSGVIATNPSIEAADAIAAAAAFGAVTSSQQQQQQYQQEQYQQQQQYTDYAGTTMPSSPTLPTWLQNLRGHLYEENIQKLQVAMKNSFFTESEALRIIYAIEAASKGDKNKISGAAEFCLIMVETMEMGTNVLIAAVFHYCSCVTAREEEQKSRQQHRQQQIMSSSSPYSSSPSIDNNNYYKQIVDSSQLRYEADTNTDKDNAFLANIKSFGGEHAVSIARDAARLKKVETVASSIMQLNMNGKVSPDRADSENLRKLLLAETHDWRALAIRSAACLYRLRGIISNAASSSRSSYMTHIQLTPEISRVCREALHIYAPLASRLGMHRLKNELERVAFRILYKRQHNAVSSLSRQSRRRASQSGEPQSNFLSVEESMNHVLVAVKDDVLEMLLKDNQFTKYTTKFAVTARVKESYSMWLKMLRNGWDHILQVPDALALRIVFDAKPMSPDEDIEVTRARERALCYYVQKKCLQRWKEAADPRFKDYIEQPKPNGYQSLHYTASIPWGGQEWSLEMQVRSGEMHSVAEYGLASHWNYKANPKQKEDSSSSQEVDEFGSSSTATPTSGCKDEYLESVKEWHWQQQQRLHQQSSLPYSPSFDDSTTSSTAATATTDDRIRERTETLAPYIEAFTTAQSDLARDHVFVFISSSSDVINNNNNFQSGHHHDGGRVLSLPSGACVLDALREMERENLGFQLNWQDQSLVGVGHNGVTANASQKLQNGDILTIDDELISSTLQQQQQPHPYQFQ